MVNVGDETTYHLDHDNYGRLNNYPRKREDGPFPGKRSESTWRRAANGMCLGATWQVATDPQRQASARVRVLQDFDFEVGKRGHGQWLLSPKHLWDPVGMGQVAY